MNTTPTQQIGPDEAWIDAHSDVWRLGDDGLMHTKDTAPFPRERVERKWGPLRLQQPMTTNHPTPGHDHSLDLTAIRARAEAANRHAGRWSVDQWLPQDRAYENQAQVYRDAGGPGCAFVASDVFIDDAEHIAGMDPSTTLALVAEVERLRERLARVLDLVDDAEDDRRRHDAMTSIEPDHRPCESHARSNWARRVGLILRENGATS